MIALAVVSNNRLVWHGVQQALQSAPHIRLVGHAAGGTDIKGLLGRSKPTVILLDLDSSFDATGIIQTVRTCAPQAKILGLGGVGAEDRMRDLRGDLDGVVLTIQPTTVMIRMIESLCAASREGAGGCGGEPVSSTGSGVDPSPSLTARERQITILVGRGLANKDIAAHLCISETTVRHHLTSIFGKLGITGRQKLLIHAHQAGFLESLHRE